MGLFSKNRRQGHQNTADDKDVPGWLRMLQDNSWELEILISGGAIFSLFQLSGLITDFFYQLSYTNYFIGRNLLFISLMLSVKGLTLGFSLHILVRSFWVSLIALSAMFPNPNEDHPIEYAQPFKSGTHKKLSELILRTNQLAAWMMYNTFSTVLIILGWMILFLILLTIGAIAGTANGNAGEVSFIIVIPLAIYMIDLFTFSSLRRIPYLSYVFYPVFKVFDFLSLRFIYQSSLDFVTRNISRWKVAAYYSVFICGAILFTYLSIFRMMHWPNVFDDREYRFNLTRSDQYYSEFLYRNKTETGKSRVASIQSDIISEPVLNVFINYSVVYDQFIKQIPDPKERYFENIWQLSVDDSIYSGLKYYTIHGNNSSTMGITTYVDVGNFKQGPHVLTIINKYEDAGSTRKKLDIPFWLDKESDQ